jgi:hypothetical protein
MLFKVSPEHVREATAEETVSQDFFMEELDKCPTSPYLEDKLDTMTTPSGKECHG